MIISDYSKIPQLTKTAGYHINMSWSYLEEWLDDQQHKCAGDQTLDLDPDFQRAHVWTEAQQIRYVEFCLRGGLSGRHIYFNHPNWMGSFKGALTLVDGKQRLTAVLRFIRNEIPAFGTLKKNFTGHLRSINSDFIININDLKTRKQLLQWYIDLNAGGVAHTDEDIAKVRTLLEKEI